MAGKPVDSASKMEKTTALVKARTLWCDGAPQLTSTRDCAQQKKTVACLCCLCVAVVCIGRKEGEMGASRGLKMGQLTLSMGQQGWRFTTVYKKLPFQV